MVPTPPEPPVQLEDSKCSAVTKEGTRIEFLVGPRAGRTGVVQKANPDDETQWLVELGDGTVLKVGKDKVAKSIELFATNKKNI